MKKVLYMSFATAGGGSVGISLDSPKSTLTDVEVKGVMDLIIQKDVFEAKTGALVRAKYAKITESTEERFDYEV